MDYPHIIATITSTPWAIMPESLKTILEILDMRLNGQKLSREEIQVRLRSSSDDRDRRFSRATIAKGTGIIPLYGPIFPRANLFTEMSGSTSIESFQQDFRQLMLDDTVESIVLDIDSPGGMTTFIQEMSEEIRQARDVKPVFAVANNLAASAAYSLGSQASQLYVTPSGMVGSIGVYAVHEDISGMEEKMGVKTTLISAGRFKVEGNPYEPLGEEARDYMQEIVEKTYDQFLTDVSLGRGVDKETVKSDYGQGRVLLAKDALKAGMVDGIKTFDDVVIGAMEGSLPVGGFRRGLAAHVFIPSPRAAEGTDDWVEMEHSEPGSGQPPTPRRQDPDRGGTDNNDRIESPPDVLPKPVTGGNPNASTFTKEGSMNEYLLRMAQTLGIQVQEDWTDEKLAEAIHEKIDTQQRELQPLREATEHAERTRAFREEFPDEYERMIRLEQRDRQASAREFADRYTNFQIKDADGSLKKSTRGFSALVLQSIESAHYKIAEGNFAVTDLEALLDGIPNGIVEYAEIGSSRTKEASGTVGAGQQLTPAQEFAAKARELMEQDNLSYDAAVKQAAERFPDLFAAYRQSVPRQTA